MPGLLFWRQWLSLIELLDVVVGGKRIQLDKAQQHDLTTVTPSFKWYNLANNSVYLSKKF